MLRVAAYCRVSSDGDDQLEVQSKESTAVICIDVIDYMRRMRKSVSPKNVDNEGRKESSLAMYEPSGKRNKILQGICFIEEEKLHSAICRALNSAIADRQEAIDLILSSLSYAITGDYDTLEIYAMEKQMHELNERLESTVKTSLKSEDDPQKIP